MSKAKSKGIAIATVDRGRICGEECKAMGTYEIEVWRDGKLVEHRIETNTVTTEGLRAMLDVTLGNEGTYSQDAAWYGMLLSSDTTESATYTYDLFLDTDAGGTITEFTAYTGGARLAWTGVLDGSTAEITNSAAKISFPITGGADVVYGAALVSFATHSDHTGANGYLMSYSKFAAGINVTGGDTVKVTITITLS